MNLNPFREGISLLKGFYNFIYLQLSVNKPFLKIIVWEKRGKGGKEDIKILKYQNTVEGMNYESSGIL